MQSPVAAKSATFCFQASQSARHLGSLYLLVCFQLTTNGFAGHLLKTRFETKYVKIYGNFQDKTQIYASNARALVQSLDGARICRV